MFFCDVFRVQGDVGFEFSYNVFRVQGDLKFVFSSQVQDVLEFVLFLSCTLEYSVSYK